MELIIVPDDDLVRAGGRLTAAVADTYSALLLSRADYESSAPPPGNVGVIFLSDSISDELGAGEKSAEHGARWGFVGNAAWVCAGKVDDPQATLDAMGAVIADMQAEAGKALAALGEIPDATAFKGTHLAGRYLDPKLRVPAQTVAGGRFAFTPERMCWERQYTLGIVQFLARGFDQWAATISG